VQTLSNDVGFSAAPVVGVVVILFFFELGCLAMVYDNSFFSITHFLYH
jgi:hypothetical protein